MTFVLTPTAEQRYYVLEAQGRIVGRPTLPSKCDTVCTVRVSRPLPLGKRSFFSFRVISRETGDIHIGAPLWMFFTC